MDKLSIICCRCWTLGTLKYSFLTIIQGNVLIIFFLTYKAVDAWDNEKPDYTLSTNTCAAGKVCGHYTQVVWANSLKVGCGYTSCANGAKIISCNYDPPGNYIGQRPYTQSSGSCTPTCPANACGSVTSCGTTISCSCASGSYCNAGTCTTCVSPCTSGVCGPKYSTSCPTVQFDCGNCASGQSCVSNGSYPLPFLPSFPLYLILMCF